MVSVSLQGGVQSRRQIPQLSMCDQITICCSQNTVGLATPTSRDGVDLIHLFLLSQPAHQKTTDKLFHCEGKIRRAYTAQS